MNTKKNNTINCREVQHIRPAYWNGRTRTPTYSKHSMCSYSYNAQAYCCACFWRCTYSTGWAINILDSASIFENRQTKCTQLQQWDIFHIDYPSFRCCNIRKTCHMKPKKKNSSCYSKNIIQWYVDRQKQQPCIVERVYSLIWNIYTRKHL